MPWTERRFEDGFTLLEVLVAFALLTIVLAAAHQTFGSGLNAVERAERRALATLRAESLIDRLNLDIPLMAGIYEGRFEDGRDWQVTIAAIGAGADAERLYQVSAAVALAEENPSDGVVLVTLRLGAVP